MAEEEVDEESTVVERIVKKLRNKDEIYLIKKLRRKELPRNWSIESCVKSRSAY